MVSDNLQFSGDKTVYFYPDCRAALVGEFDHEGHLIKGQATEIIGLEQDALLFLPIFMAPDQEVKKAFEISQFFSANIYIF